MMNNFLILCSGFELGRKLVYIMNLKLSLCMCAPKHLNCYRKPIREDLNGQNITNLKNLYNTMNNIAGYPTVFCCLLASGNVVA